MYIGDYSSSEIVILDVEASGLSSDSYPIEIAWVSIINGGDNDQFLIDHKTADNWKDWDECAESLHGISRLSLKSGLCVFIAAQRLNSQLCGCVAVSDHSATDKLWIDKLFKEAGIDRKFEIIDILDLSSGCDSEYYNQFRVLKSKRIMEHRALSDCMQLRDIYNELGIFEEVI